MIYVPDIEHFECFTMHDGYIRAYGGINDVPSYVAYTDFFYNSNYYSVSGYEELTEFPSCIPSSQLTTNYLYRNDLDKILVIFVILAFVIIYLPIRLVFHLFNRRKRV